MRILFELAHPKHAHLFRYAILELQSRGHTIGITARRKDVTLRLLDAWGFPYACLSDYPSGGILALGVELVIRYWRLWKFARRFKPDVFVARVGPAAATVGFLMRKPVIVFEDTEGGTLQQKIAFPFATEICTATHYEKDWGKKHVRHESFDELAYLHPKRFTPDPDIARKAGLVPGEYIILRLVAWQAAHDVGQHGIPVQGRRELIQRLEKFGRVVISSEAPLPPDLEPYHLPVPPEDFHHVLAFSRLTFGESSTVATEGALLGVPGIMVNTMDWGSVNSLVKQQLLFQTTNSRDALEIAERLLADPETPHRWRCRLAELLEQKIDLTHWMVERIESRMADNS